MSIQAAQPDVEDFIEDIPRIKQGRKAPRKRTRQAKQEEGVVKHVKEKFVEERRNVPPLKPLNEVQAEYIKLINTKSLIISTGLPGTSKTYIPTVMACDKFLAGSIDRIYLTRPNVSNSKSLGFFGGSLVEKMSNWLLPVLGTMYERLGKAAVEIAIKNGDIAFVPLETIKGMSFGKNTFVIGDEVEDMTIAEAKSVVTRQGGCTMVLAGDVEQSCLEERSGLAWLTKMVNENPALEESTGFVDFSRPSDIVRSKACKDWILAMRREAN